MKMRITLGLFIALACSNAFGYSYDQLAGINRAICLKASALSEQGKRVFSSLSHAGSKNIANAYQSASTILAKSAQNAGNTYSAVTGNAHAATRTAAAALLSSFTKMVDMGAETVLHGSSFALGVRLGQLGITDLQKIGFATAFVGIARTLLRLKMGNDVPKSLTDILFHLAEVGLGYGSWYFVEMLDLVPESYKKYLPKKQSNKSNAVSATQTLPVVVQQPQPIVAPIPMQHAPLMYIPGHPGAQQVALVNTAMPQQIVR